jgi:hypothetical protein
MVYRLAAPATLSVTLLASQNASPSDRQTGQFGRFFPKARAAQPPFQKNGLERKNCAKIINVS